jgi:hypothetical protein
MSEEEKIRFDEAPFTSSMRHRLAIHLKKEGFKEEQISDLPLIRRTFRNPLGLNEIVFDVSGWIAPADDWDQDANLVSSLKKATSDRSGQEARRVWARILEEQAFRYLDRWLKEFGWTLKNGEGGEDEESRCIGWREGARDIMQPDLVVEMLFPMPEDFDRPDPSYVIENTKNIRESLKKVNAKSKYILIGVPQDKTITTFEFASADSKVVYQRHRFKRARE